MAQNENDRNAGGTNQPGQQGRTTAGNQGSNPDKKQDPYMQNQGGTGSDTGSRNMGDKNLERETGNVSGSQSGQSQQGAQGTTNRSGAGDEQTRQRGNDTSHTNQDKTSQSQSSQTQN